MAVNIISFWALNLALNHVKFICHSYFSVLITEVCQSSNSFVSVSLPLCTQTKWAPITVIICFRKAISIHRIELRLETSQPKWEFGLRREWAQKTGAEKPLHWADLRKNVAKWVDYDTAEFCKILGAVANELWTTEIINKNMFIFHQFSFYTTHNRMW